MIMPARLTLISKKTKKAENFPAIDAKMCKALGVKTDPELFYRSWYDGVGMALALGKTFAELRKEFQEYLDMPVSDTAVNEWKRTSYTKDLQIVNFLDANYIVKN
jgi:hypothetical protein